MFIQQYPTRPPQLYHWTLRFITLHSFKNLATSVVMGFAVPVPLQP